jgi:hypothetical protein
MAKAHNFNNFYYIQKKIMAKDLWEHAIQDQPRSSRDFWQLDRTIFRPKLVYINIPDISSEDMDVIETNCLKAN